MKPFHHDISAQPYTSLNQQMTAASNLEFSYLVSYDSTLEITTI